MGKRKSRKKKEDFLLEIPMAETSVFIDRQVYQKVMHWVNKSDFEVSGLGKVVMKDGIFQVVDAVLLPQENTATTTDIDPAHMGKLMFLTKDTPGHLNWWFHSHVDMDVFWSSTDLDTIKKLGKGGWFLSTVFNKRREFKSSFYSKAPIETFFNDLPTRIGPEIIDEELAAAWDKQYKDNVKNVKPKWTSSAFGPRRKSKEDDDSEIDLISNFLAESIGERVSEEDWRTNFFSGNPRRRIPI